MAGPDLTSSRLRRLLRLLAGVCAVLACTGCQVKVAVDAHVAPDGHGVLTVGVGLDAKAQERLGDLDQELRLGDLEGAGWTVSAAEEAPDGLTWVRASHDFASVDELNQLLAQLTGEPAMVRDLRLTEEDAGTATVHRLTGTVDLTAGIGAFRDPQLGARLGGDPVADRVAAIEAEEGRKVADMIAVDVSARIDGGEAQVRQPRLDDTAPLALEVVAREAKPPTSFGGGAPLGAMALAGVLVVAMLAAARQAFRRSAR